MILPELEANRHGAEVVALFFFGDNVQVLSEGNPIGERLSKLAEARNMMMMCDQCALERSLATGRAGECQPYGTVVGTQVGCFPDLYAALAANPPEHIFSL